ncbi:MAG: hypothetical protein HUK05_05350 [Prevotella sp.]|nr:hypothetical protein [Prevotella sp.]
MLTITSSASYAQYPNEMYLDVYNNAGADVKASNNGIFTFKLVVTGGYANFKFHTWIDGLWNEYGANTNGTTPIQVSSGNSYNIKHNVGGNLVTWVINGDGTYTIQLDLTNNTVTIDPSSGGGGGGGGGGSSTTTDSKIHGYVDHVALNTSDFAKADYSSKTGVDNSNIRKAQLKYTLYSNSTRQIIQTNSSGYGYTVTINKPSKGCKGTVGDSDIAYLDTDGFFKLKSGATYGEEVWTATIKSNTDANEEALVVSFDVTCSEYAYVNSAAETQYDVDETATETKWKAFDGKKYVYKNSASDALVEFYAGDNPYVKQSDGTMNRLIWNNGTSAVSPWGVGATSESSYINNPPTTGNDKNRYKELNRGWSNRLYHPSPNLNAMTEKHKEYSSASTADNKQQITNEQGIDVNGAAKKYFYYQYVYTEGDEFGMPVVGSFYRFYPKQDGRMSVYFLMNGVTDASNETKGNAAFGQKCRDRRTYFLNAKSQSLPKLTIDELNAGKEGVTETKAQKVSTINPAFFGITPATIANATASTGVADAQWWKECVKQVLKNWELWGNPTEKKPTQAADWDSMTDAEKTAWGNLVNDPEGIHHQPFQNADGSYSVISPAYVKATLNVKAGETYYLTPTITKTRLCAVDFFPSTNSAISTPTDVDFYEGTLQTTTPTNMSDYELPTNANDWMTSANEGKHFNVTLKDRSFKAGTWYSFYFPFNVSVAEVKKWFGDDAYTLHFDGVRYNNKDAAGETMTLLFTHHFYPQICAGSPIFIRTSDNMTARAAGDVKFSNLYYRDNVHSTPKTFVDTDKGFNWVFRGSYKPCSMGKNTYFMAGTTDKVDNGIYHVRTEKKTPGNRAWINREAGTASSSADVPAVASISIDGLVEDGSNEEATAIIELLEEMGFNVRKANDCIYNVSGQVVGHGNDFEALPKGIYIINGKKIMK